MFVFPPRIVIPVEQGRQQMLHLSIMRQTSSDREKCSLSIPRIDLRPLIEKEGEIHDIQAGKGKSHKLYASEASFRTFLPMIRGRGGRGDPAASSPTASVRGGGLPVREFMGLFPYVLPHVQLRGICLLLPDLFGRPGALMLPGQRRRRRRQSRGQDGPSDHEVSLM